MLLEPYLIFQGNCEEAFTFYQTLFESDFTSFVRYGEMDDGRSLSAEEQNKILFISLPVGENIHLMGSDNLEKAVTGTNFALSLSLGTLDQDQVKWIFDHLSEGGEVLMPFQETYWADRFGMCRDRFGIQWRINYRVTEYM